MRWVGIVFWVAIGAVLGVALLAFAQQNVQPLTLYFLNAEPSEPIPVWKVVYAAAAIGAALPLLGMLILVVARAREVRQLRRANALLRQELDAAKIRPSHPGQAAL